MSRAIITLTKVELPVMDLFTEQTEHFYQMVNTSLGCYKVPSASFAKRKQVCRLLIQGLYKAYCSLNPNIALAVPHAAGAYSKMNSKGYISSYRLVVPIVQVLITLGWATVTKGRWRKDGTGEVTSLKPAGDLLEAFKQKRICFQEYPLIQDPIVLRSYDFATKRKQLLPTPKSDKVRHMGAQVNRINRFLKKQAICLLIENTEFPVLNGKMLYGKKANLYQYRQAAFNQRILDFSKVQLRRIFSRSKMDLGGRFYGGWWQIIPKEYRMHITINSLPTVEIDYSGLHLIMLYHLEGLEPPMEDPYDLGLWKTPAEREVRRPLIKQLVNAMINDEYGVYILTKEEKTLLGIKSTKRLKEKILKQHAPIAHRFNSGYGLRLQYLDSIIANEVMQHLLAKNIAVLPVHDSFIVDYRYGAELQNTMLTVYEEIYGRPVQMKRKFLFDTSHHRRVHPVPFMPDGSVDQAILYRTMAESIHNHYVASQMR